MRSSINQAVKPRLLDLKFIERYGGVVIPVTEVVESDNGRERITFPVSCDIEGKECYERGNYFELALNDQYRSVAYWEIQGSASRQTPRRGDRKSTRLNSSHVAISYAVFCLKKKRDNETNRQLVA